MNWILYRYGLMFLFCIADVRYRNRSIDASILFYYSIQMKNYFKVNSVEVITGQKNDLLKINFICSNWQPWMVVYKFRDTRRHKRSFKLRITSHSTDFLMYNIKNKWSKDLVRCKSRYRSDGTLMIEEPII